MKTCTKCGESKPLAQFYRLGISPDGRAWACKKCQDATNRAWVGAHKKRANATSQRWRLAHPESRRATMLRARFGIDITGYDTMLRAQGGRCAICGNEASAADRLGRRLAVDHDHDSGVVRGLLCRRCNVVLGAVEDNPAILQAAIDYLTTPREKTA